MTGSKGPAAQMRAARLWLIAVAWLSMPPVAAANEPAPFGLTWGMSVDALRRSGVQLYERAPDESGRRFSVFRLPTMLDDLEEVVLSFGMNDKLHRIEAISNDFRYDADGTRLKARYRALGSALAAKYGSGKQTHDVNKPWDRPKDFLMGIQLGSSRWFSDFEGEQVAVHLEITARRSDVGKYILIYRHKGLEDRSRERPGEREVL